MAANKVLTNEPYMCKTNLNKRRFKNMEVKILILLCD